MRILERTIGDRSATLTCYVADTSPEMSTATPRPFALVLPGGGYSMTSDREAEPVALAYVAEGFTAGVLRYSVGPEASFEDAFRDATSAVDWVRANADALGIDPSRVAAIGFSAGGHLAGSLGILSSARPNALVLGYPVTLSEFDMGKKVPDLPSAVTRETPPVFVFHTFADTLVPVRHTTELITSLAQHEVPFEARIYLLGGHGLSLAKSHTANGAANAVDPAAASWFADSVHFLRDVLGDVPTSGTKAGYQDLLARRRIGVRMLLRDLTADDRARAILAEHAPQILAALDSNPMAGAVSLRDLLDLAPEALPQPTYRYLETELDRLNN